MSVIPWYARSTLLRETHVALGILHPGEPRALDSVVMCRALGGTRGPDVLRGDPRRNEIAIRLTGDRTRCDGVTEQSVYVVLRSE